MNNVFLPFTSELESAHGAAIVLENIPENMNIDMLSMLVETVSGLDEGSFNLEIIWETKKAVVTLNDPTGREKKHLVYTTPVSYLNDISHLVATVMELLGLNLFSLKGLDI